MILRSRLIVYGALAIAGVSAGIGGTAIFHNRILVERNRTLTMQLKQGADTVHLQPIIANGIETTSPDFCHATIGMFFDVTQILQNKTEACEQKLADTENELDHATGKTRVYKYESWLTLLRLREERQKPRECEPVR